MSGYLCLRRKKQRPSVWWKPWTWGDYDLEEVPLKVQPDGTIAPAEWEDERSLIFSHVETYAVGRVAVMRLPADLRDFLPLEKQSASLTHFYSEEGLLLRIGRLRRLGIRPVQSEAALKALRGSDAKKPG